MKLLRFFTTILVVCVVGLTACSNTPTPTATTFTDDIGRTVQLNGTPQRIVSLSPSNTEILFALGLGAEVVGTDDYSDYPAEAKTITHVGSAFPSFNIETIVSLKPDLAVAFGYTLPDYVTKLQSLGIPVVVLAPKDVNGVINDITLIGKITGATSEAKTLTTSMQNSLNTVESTIKGVTHPRVLWEFDGTDPGNPWVAGPGSFNDALITLAGGQDVGAGGPTSSWQMNSEEVINADPQIIILDDYQYGVTTESVQQRPGWSTIIAVENGAIYPITDSNLTDRPGPRVIDGLELLAQMIHPELFK
jgi:iron complex transport system substrate-binding protein